MRRPRAAALTSADAEVPEPVYNGFVDFGVASKLPADPELSAAAQSACAVPELSIANNNAHSVNQATTNP